MPRRLKTPSSDSPDLRTRAEALVGRHLTDLQELSPEEAQQLLHELEVHQVELEMQNRELRDAQQELEASRDRYAGLYDFAPVGYMTLDTKSCVHQINLTAARLLGTERSRLIGRQFASYVVKEHKAQFRGHLRECAAGSLRASCELLLCPKASAPVFVGLDTVRVEDDKSTRYRTAITDITERKRTEEALESLAERKQLEKALAERSAQERHRFGREIHDGLGQELTGLGYLVTLLRNKLQAAGDPKADVANQLAEGIQHAIGAAREIARGVLPVDPESGGLKVALERLLAQTEAYFGIACHLRGREPAQVEDHQVASELFRIAQEAVTNAARHAGAKQIEVELSRQPEGVALLVRDDGAGLPNDLSQSVGMGLRIMRHRAARIGAILDVRPSNGRGTEVCCMFQSEPGDVR